MYYCLKKNYILRGYKLLGTGIIDTDKGTIDFLPKDKYEALTLCNGIYDSDLVFIDDKARKYFEELYQEGYVEKSEVFNDIIVERQKYKYYDNRFIRHVHWAMTGNCNYKCRHCYTSAPHAKHTELDFESCKKIIEEFASCGVVSVSLTGGEALVHKYFWEIIDLLIEHNIYIKTIYSNGYLINEQFFEKCKKRNIKPMLSFSFDGVDGCHEWLRNVPNAFLHIEKAMDLCNKKGFKFSVEYCLHRKNVYVLKDSIKFLQDKKCISAKVVFLNSIGEGENISDLVLSPDEKEKALLDFIKDYIKEGLHIKVYLHTVVFEKNTYYLPLVKELTEDVIDDYCVCGHARSVLYLSQEGVMSPCVALIEKPDIAKSFPNILDVGMREALNNSYYLKTITTTYGEYLRHNKECQECEYRYKCVGGCRANAMLNKESNDWLCKNDAMCHYFKEEMVDRIIKACEDEGYKRVYQVNDMR